MAGRIRERDLIIPSLRVAAAKPNGDITTADLIVELTEEFVPEGDDAEILDGRHDTKFSQKVRNLVSHRDGKQTMFALGYAEYTGDGIKITEAGRHFLKSLPHE
jgi:hypothetical protein